MPIIGLDDDIRALALNILEDAANELLEDLKDAAPVKTGETRDSAYGPDLDDAAMTATIGFDTPQSDYTNVGTAPHVISSRGDYPMVFFWENGPNGPGTYAYHSVNHPGIEPTYWFDDLVDQWDDYVQRAADDQP